MKTTDVPFLSPEWRWECPNCDATHVTQTLPAHTPFHPCRGLAGLTAPYVPAGTKAAVELRLREDYLAGDEVPVDVDGRPVMSVVTTRDDGEDVAVYAPTANAKLKES